MGAKSAETCGRHGRLCSTCVLPSARRMGWWFPLCCWCWRRFSARRRGLVSIGPARRVLPVIPRESTLRRARQRLEYGCRQSHSGHKRLQQRLYQQDGERNQCSLSKPRRAQCGHSSLSPGICSRAAGQSQHRPGGFERSCLCASRAVNAERRAPSSQRGRSSRACARAPSGASDGTPGSSQNDATSRSTSVHSPTASDSDQRRQTDPTLSGAPAGSCQSARCKTQCSDGASSAAGDSVKSTN